MTPARAWIATLRPKTLPAGLVPVVVGTAYAHHIGALAWLPAVAALAGALLLQIGTNLANDYYDHVKGADTPDRSGPVRASASGAIPARTVRNAAYYTFLAAALVGVYLITIGGLPILLIGVAGIASGILYTAGPRPLGYVGLGDLFVFVFFGPVAVAGTVYVQSLTWEWGAVWWGVGVGALATAILVVNNLRDIPTDAAAGKRTLAVRLGEAGSRREYLTLLLIAGLVPIVMAVNTNDAAFFLPVAAIAAALPAVRVVMEVHDDRSRLNGALAHTGRVLLLYGVLAAAGLVA